MTHERFDTLILGGGVTGLAAGIASAAPILEAEAFPGGICSSYYMRRNSAQRMAMAGADGEAYRFEHGGGHWIFGGHPDVLRIIERLAPCERFSRRSSVFFPEQSCYVGFPLQYHLRQLPPATAACALNEILGAQATDVGTMAQWLEGQFGRTLAELFFHPFHEAYTAGLWRDIAPQDGYKTPLDRREVLRGASGSAVPAGYNVTFLYPRDGLDVLVARLAARTDLHCGHPVVRIDVAARELVLDDGRVLRYGRLLSTLPLNRIMALTGLRTRAEPDPYTSVLVLNIGAERGPKCPEDHWLYVPKAHSGFHRVGFYSNVREHFLPASARGRHSATCLYVERSYRGGEKPDEDELTQYAASAVRELQSWGFIGKIEALDPSWVDVAYTWSYPGSSWVGEAIAALASHDIWVAGRYARWNFQGIADSLRDGLIAGQALRLST